MQTQLKLLLMVSILLSLLERFSYTYFPSRKKKKLICFLCLTLSTQHALIIDVPLLSFFLKKGVLSRISFFLQKKTLILDSESPEFAPPPRPLFSAALPPPFSLTSEEMNHVCLFVDTSIRGAACCLGLDPSSFSRDIKQNYNHHHDILRGFVVGKWCRAS